VQDLPGTIQNARSTCAFPPSVRERITFQEQDFFTPQSSSQEVDVFLLRMILHDWRDPDAIKILRNLLDASARQAKAVSIIVMDIVMPESGGRSDSSIPRTQQMDLRVRDLTMLQAHGARERDLQDWKQLFTAADPRLTLRNVVRPFKSMMSVMELGVEQTS
jgi:6-hydroxytryprostatin B O-methyltransferase